MFDYASDGGLGFQLSMYRLLDSLDEARQMGRENVLIAQKERLRAEYNRLLAYTQGIERDLEQRNQELADTQKELAQVKAAAVNQQRIAHEMMIVRMDRAKAEEQERLSGSQPTQR